MKIVNEKSSQVEIKALGKEEAGGADESGDKPQGMRVKGSEMRVVGAERRREKDFDYFKTDYNRI